MQFQIGDRIRIGGQHSQAGRQGVIKNFILSNKIARVALDPKPYWREQTSDVWLAHVSYLEKYETSQSHRL